jgi:hypothetical protein
MIKVGSTSAAAKSISEADHGLLGSSLIIRGSDFTIVAKADTSKPHTSKHHGRRYAHPLTSVQMIWMTVNIAKTVIASIFTLSGQPIADVENISLPQRFDAAASGRKSWLL